LVRYVQKNNYQITSLDDEWIILNTDENTLTKVNELGAFCWPLLREAQSVQSLSEAILRKFGHTFENLEEDVARFLQELLECGLIRYIPR
jgi:hypothetical protein